MLHMTKLFVMSCGCLAGPLTSNSAARVNTRDGHAQRCKSMRISVYIRALSFAASAWPSPVNTVQWQFCILCTWCNLSCEKWCKALRNVWNFLSQVEIILLGSTYPHHMKPRGGYLLWCNVSSNVKSSTDTTKLIAPLNTLCSCTMCTLHIAHWECLKTNVKDTVGKLNEMSTVQCAWFWVHHYQAAFFLPGLFWLW